MLDIEPEIFNPERTLGSLVHGHSRFSPSTLAALSYVDVNRIDDGIFQEATDFWCSALSSARSCFTTEKLTMNSNFVPVLLRLSRIAIQFAARRYSNGIDDAYPVISLLGMNSTMANELKFPVKLPIAQFDINQRCQFAELMAARMNTQTVSVDDVLHIGLYLAVRELFGDQSSKTKEVVASLAPEYGELSEEVSERLLEFDSVDSLVNAAGKLPDIDNPMLFMVLKYVYEWMNNVKIVGQVLCADFYTRMMACLLTSQKRVEIDQVLPVFVYVSGDDVPMPVDLDSRRFDGKKLFAALALSRLTHSVIVKGSVPKPIPENVVLLAVQNEKKKVLERHVVEMVQIAMHVMTRMVEMNPRVFGLINDSMKGDVNAARRLLNHPECVYYLHPEKSRFNKLVYTLLSKDVHLPEPTNISIQMATAILRMRQLRMEPPGSYVFAVLKNAHEKLRYLTEKICGNRKNRIRLVSAGLSWPNASIKVVSIVLKSPADYISSAADNSFESIALTLMTILPFVEKNTQRKEDSICDILADFALHYALGSKLKRLISDHFSDTFAKSKDERRIYHVLSALEDKDSSNDTIAIIEPVLKTDISLLEAVTGFFIRRVEDYGIDVFSKFSNDTLNVMNLALRLDILELMIRHDAVEKAKSFAVALFASCNKELLSSVFSILGRYALTSSSTVLGVFQAVEHDERDAYTLIESLPLFSGEISGDFAELLRLMLRALPLFRFVNQKSPIRKEFVSSIWSEDGETDNQSGKSLWSEQKVHRECTSSEGVVLQNAFVCNTCKTVSMCEHCALSFHHGHDLAYLGESEFKCCGNSRRRTSDESLTKTMYVPKDPNQASTDGISANALARLFVSLSRAAIGKDLQPQPLKEITPVNTIQLAQLSQQIVKAKYSFVPFDTHASVIDSKAIGREIKKSENLGRFARRMVVSPYSVAACSGRFLVVADGNKLRSFSLSDYEEASSIDMPIIPLELKLCPIDVNVIAVASMKRVIIYTLANDGSFSMMNEIELMLDSLGPQIFVNSIHWVPMAPLHLAVVCSTFVKVYDVPTDCFAPIGCFSPPQNSDAFTSAVFIERADECIGLLALASGQIAVQNMAFGDNDFSGNRPLRNFLKMPGIPIQPIISYCNESDVLFITAPGAVVKMARLSDVLAEKKPEFNLNVGSLPGEMVFVGTLPSNRSIHVMVHPNSGSLTGIEITENGVEVFGLCEDYPRQPVNPIIDDRAIIVSTFQTDDDFYAIESDGSISVLRFGEIEVDDEIDANLSVSPSFWLNSRISTNGISMKAPHVKEICRLYSGEELLMPANVEKRIEVSSNSSDQLIVGFRIKTENAPEGSYVKLQGRRTILHDVVCLPLRHTEVKPRATYKIEFFGDEICCKKIDVFCVSASELAQMSFPDEFDWKVNAMNLYDFKEESARFGSELHRLCSLCSMAIVGDCSVIDLELVRALVRVIYTVPELSNTARSVICRIAMEREHFSVAWGEALKELLERKEIPSSTWNLVWRDYELMPKCVQHIVSPFLWKNAPQSKCIDPFVSAFLA